MTEVSVRIPLSDPVRERWEKLIYNRGYARSLFLRAFIEAVTDPVQGPIIEQIIQGREPIPEQHE